VSSFGGDGKGAWGGDGWPPKDEGERWKKVGGETESESTANKTFKTLGLNKAEEREEGKVTISQKAPFRRKEI